MSDKLLQKSQSLDTQSSGSTPSQASGPTSNSGRVEDKMGGGKDRQWADATRWLLGAYVKSVQEQQRIEKKLSPDVAPAGLSEWLSAPAETFGEQFTKGIECIVTLVTAAKGVEGPTVQPLGESSRVRTVLDEVSRLLSTNPRGAFLLVKAELLDPLNKRAQRNATYGQARSDSAQSVESAFTVATAPLLAALAAIASATNPKLEALGWTFDMVAHGASVEGGAGNGVVGFNEQAFYSIAPFKMLTHGAFGYGGLSSGSVGSAGVNVAIRMRKTDTDAEDAPAPESWEGIFGGFTLGQVGTFFGNPATSPVWVGISLSTPSPKKIEGSVTDYKQLDG